MKKTNRARLNNIKMLLDGARYLSEKDESENRTRLIINLLYELKDDVERLIIVAEKEGIFSLDTESEDD